MSARWMRREDGASAVIVAICALLLFCIAALAVDLTNAYSRKRDVQTQADFAALAGGAHLGNGTTADVTHEVATYLIKNYPQTDDGAYPNFADEPAAIATLQADLTNGDRSDGEVYFGLWKPGMTSATTLEHTLTVVSPQAQVNFGLAAAMGFSNTRVQAFATVGIRSPGSIVPFFMPQNCRFSPVALKASNYNPGAPTFNPPSASGNSIPKLDTLDTFVINAGAPVSITVTGDNYRLLPNAEFYADFHREGTSERVPNNTANGITPTQATIGSGKVADTATVLVPPGVYNNPGFWYIRLHNESGYSKDALRIEVKAPPPPEGCGQKSTGDFGVLDSPRKPPVSQLSDATALNIAKGLDHMPQAWDPPTSAPVTPDMDPCQGMGGTPPPGAVNDTQTNLEAGLGDTVNCLGVKNGMNVPVVAQGLITGGTTLAGNYEGRLNAPATPGCDRPRVSRLNVDTNDDVLSCFLPPDGTTTVGDIIGNPDGTLDPTYKHILDSDVLTSPRFIWVPIIIPINPQNGYYPLVGYWPAFITDESIYAKNGDSCTCPVNGTVIQNNSQIVQLNVVPIHPDALPETTDENVGQTMPWIGTGPKLVRLID